MSLQCVTSPVYRTSAHQKMVSKQAAKQYRFGSPKLRDQLREACRLRVREARQSRFGSRRCLEPVKENESMEKFDFNAMLRQELASLESDLLLQEEIYKEVFDDMNEWFALQLEAEESHLISMAESVGNNEVICPICQKFELSVSSPAGEGLGSSYTCQCGISFNFSPGVKEELREALLAKLKLHDEKCPQTLHFFLEPQPSGGHKLNAFCENCEYYCSF